MSEQLEKKLRMIPERPGIYKMLDETGNIIYIGKSKCLKKRVHSYFVPTPKWDKVLKMRPLIADLDYEVTDTHLEAMLLECRMIKDIQPYFNVQFKNDQRYRFLTVEEDVRRNPLRITGERGKDSFGPLRRKRPLEELTETLRNLYPIQKRRGSYSFSYHVLPKKLTKEEFVENRKSLQEILFQKKCMERFEKKLLEAMKETSKNQQYERAVKFRELIFSFQYLYHCLLRYELLQTKKLLYQVPVEEGWKLFLIQKGMVTDRMLVKENTEEEKRRFLEHAKRKDGLPSLPEKSRLDYEDILFAELEHAPEEWLRCIEREEESNDKSFTGGR